MHLCLFQQIAKGAGGKGPRQKASKIVKKCQKVFRHFSTIFAQGKKRQKSSKSVKKFFDTFRRFSRRAPFFRPLLQSAGCFGGMNLLNLTSTMAILNSKKNMQSDKKSTTRDMPPSQSITFFQGQDM